MTKQQFIKRLKHLGIELQDRDIFAYPYDSENIRSFQVYENLKHSTCSKIKELLNASDLMFKTEYSDERGQGPILIEIIYA